MEQYAVVTVSGEVLDVYNEKLLADSDAGYRNTRPDRFIDGPYSVARVVLEPTPDPPPNPGKRRVWWVCWHGSDEVGLYRSRPHPVDGMVWSAVIPAYAWELVEDSDG